MVDIKEQVEFNIQTEEKNIVVTNHPNHPLSKEFLEVLGEDFNNVTEPFTVIHTLGKLKAKKVYVVNFSKLMCGCKKDKIYDQIASIKEDVVVLVDTFETEQYLQIMQDLSERIITKKYAFTKLKSKKEETNQDFFYYGETEIYEAVKKGYVFGESINLAKDLVNTPYNYLNAVDLANFAKELERFDTITVENFDKAQIEEMNMVQV